MTDSSLDSLTDAGTGPPPTACRRRPAAAGKCDELGRAAPSSGQSRTDRAADPVLTIPECCDLWDDPRNPCPCSLCHRERAAADEAGRGWHRPSCPAILNEETLCRCRPPGPGRRRAPALS